MLSIVAKAASMRIAEEASAVNALDLLIAMTDAVTNYCGLVSEYARLLVAGGGRITVPTADYTVTLSS